MKIELVVEEFLKLLSQKKAKEAEELVVEEARGREDEVAGYLLMVGAKIGDEGHHFMALLCLEAAGKVVKSEGLMDVIVQGLAIVHNNYANLLQDMKRHEEAEEHYKEALKINPEDAEAHYNYAILLTDMKKYEEAEEHYKEALKINPEYAEAHYNYAILLKNMKKYEEAEEHYKEALKINPENAEAHYNYANLLKNMKKYEEAEEHYKEALKINPEFAEANANLGIFYFTTGDLESALQWLKKASCLFKKEGKRIDSIRANGLASWALARKFWESFSSTREETYANLEEARKYYLEAASEIEDMGVPELSPFFDFLSDAIFIGKDFLLSRHGSAQGPVHLY